MSRKLEDYLPVVKEAGLNTNKDAVFGGDVTITGTLTNAAVTSITDNLSLTGTLNADGNTTLGGTLAVTGATSLGTAEAVAIKGIYAATVAVTVPSITDPDEAHVDVDVSAAFTMQPAVGDVCIVSPAVALPTNCNFLGAWVSATDQVTITYGSEGGNVTGASKNHTIVIVDLT